MNSRVRGVTKPDLAGAQHGAFWEPGSASACARPDLAPYGPFGKGANPPAVVRSRAQSTPGCSRGYTLSTLPAPTKLTPKDKAEILRRRASGEGIQPIARDYGIAHQTVSRIVKQARERAELESQRQTGPPINAAPEGDLFVLRGTDKRKNAKPPFVFESWAARDAYYEARRLESERDLCISNEVRRRYPTHAEVRRGLVVRQ